MTDQDARILLEGIRWPNGPECVQCGSKDVTLVKAKASGKHPERKGLYSCRNCRRQFTVTVGTIFQGTHLPLNKLVLLIQNLSEFFNYGKSLNQISKEVGLRYLESQRIVSQMRERDLKTIHDIMEMSTSYKFIKDNVRSLLWDESEDSDAFRAGHLILLKMMWGIQTPEKLSRVSGYDQGFVSRVFQNCEQNLLWGKKRVQETDDWTDMSTWNKDKNLVSVGFMLHVLCALGEIKRSFDNDPPLYELKERINSK